MFGIGSCTKAFTAYSIGQLVDKKAISSWDDPIQKDMPGLVLWDPYITEHASIRDLLTHRTGWWGSDFLAFNVALSREDLAQRFHLFKPKDGFRERYHLPARNRGKHVWSFWGAVSKKLRAALAEHFRARHRSKDPPKADPCDRKISKVVGAIPARESLAALLG